MSDKLALISESELSLVENNLLTKEQAQLLLRRTPKTYVKQRPAKGGGQWDYVTGGYVKKVLNLMFGYRWSFSIVDKELNLAAKQVIVHGRLTIETKGEKIIKEQFGCKDVMFRKADQTPLNLGNDYKAAATDALKKCAAEIGIAADIYNKEEFKEVEIKSEEEQYQLLCELFLEVGDKLSPDNQINIEAIIKDKEEKSYTKAIRILQKLK